MKKLFLLALAFCSLTAFAQTNLFDKSTATFESWFGDAAWGQIFTSTASYDATTGAITCTLDQTPFGQWHAQLKLTHNVDLAVDTYYGFSCKFTSTAAANGITIKMDDNTATLYADQSVNAPAGEYVFTDTVKCEAAGNNHVLVFDLGNVASGVTVVISDIKIYEATAPAPKTFNGCGDTFVSTSGNAAAGHDGNTGTRWESASKDPQYWQWNMAEAQTFNRIKIVWEGAYGKTFNIKAGMSCDNLTTIASVENQSLAGFPYTQIIELAESVTASSIQFEGLARGTGYGYSFWEFDVYEQQAQVVTAVELTAAAAFAKVGTTVNLTPVVKDQYNVAMTDQTVTYEVTPAAAGTVANNVFTAAQAGEVSIIAKVGEVASAPVTLNVYAGENRVLSTNIDNDNKIIDQSCDLEGAHNAFFAVDANEGSIWEPISGTGAVRDTVCWFVADMGALYDLEIATVKFEGASSKAYTIEVSANNVDWTVIVADGTTPGMATVTNIHDMSAAKGVRYVKYHSTENATQYGHKMFDFKVFGVEHQDTPTAIDNVEAVKAVKVIENGKIVIIKNGVRYNAQGARL